MSRIFKFFQKTKDLIFRKQKSILSSALIISAMIAFSRILGFVRYRVFSYFFTKEQLDIFFASFRVPDSIFEVVILGSLSYSLIPMFLKYKHRSKNFNTILSSTLTIFSLFLILLIVLAIIFSEQLIKLITPGFSPEQQAKVMFFTRIILITQVPFLTIGNILMAIAQVEKRFLLTALAPLFYNLSIILITLVFASSYGLTAVFVGVIIGAFFYALSQFWVLSSSDFKYRPSLKITSSLKDFLHLSGTRVLLLFIKQIEANVELALSTLLGLGSYTAFYLAQRLQFLPVSLIGQAISQAAYPFLSSFAEKKQKTQIKNILKSQVLLVSFITIPISFFVIFTRTPLIRVFFGGAKFDWQATVSTAYTFSFFAFSIPFHSIFYLFNKTFFAYFKTKVPVFVNSLSTFLTIALSYLFILFWKKPVWYLAMAFSISISLNTLVLGFFLHKEFRFADFELLKEVFKVYLISSISAFVSYQFMRLVDGLFIETVNFYTLIVLLSSTFLLFISIFAFLSWFLGIREFSILSAMFKKLNRYRKDLIQYYTSVE